MTRKLPVPPANASDGVSRPAVLAFEGLIETWMENWSNGGRVVIKLAGVCCATRYESGFFECRVQTFNDCGLSAFRARF